MHRKPQRPPRTARQRSLSTTARRIATCAQALCGAWLMFWPGWASAQTHTHVDVTACSTQSRVEGFQSALRIELSALDASVELPDPAAEQSAGQRLSVTRCALDEGVLEVSLSTPAMRTPERRTLDLHDVPEPARARVAAIAIAEMVRAWPAPMPLAAKQAPSPPAPALQASPSVNPQAPAPPTAAQPRTQRLELAAQATAVGREPLLLYGVGLAVSRLTRPWLRTGLAASYQNAQFEDAIGTANLNAFGVELAAAVPLSPRGSAELGPFVGGAYLRASAKSVLDIHEEPDAAWTATVGLRAQWHSELGSHMGLVSSLAVGHTLRGANFRAANEPAFGYEGVLVEVRLGLELTR